MNTIPLTKILLVVTITPLSGGVFQQGYTQPTYSHCKNKESIMHYNFSKRKDLRSFRSTCGKQYRIIYWSHQND